MLSAILQYRFMQYAVLASLLASVVCGIIGVIIVEKKMIMLRTYWVKRDFIVNILHLIMNIL